MNQLQNLHPEIQTAILKVINDGEIAEVKLEHGKPVVVRISRRVIFKKDGGPLPRDYT